MSVAGVAASNIADVTAGVSAQHSVQNPTHNLQIVVALAQKAVETATVSMNSQYIRYNRINAYA